MSKLKELSPLIPILLLVAGIVISFYRLFITCPPVCEAQGMRCVDVTPPWTWGDFRCICEVPGDRIHLKPAGTP